MLKRRKVKSVSKFVSVALLALLLLGTFMNFLPIAKADIDFISVDDSFLHDSIRTTQQHHTFFDLDRYWIFYFNTTYINYRTVFRNGTVSQEYPLREWTHGKSFSIWNNSTSHEIDYVWSDSALYSSGVYYRKGTLQSDNSISWVAAEQTVIPPSATFAYYSANIAVDSEGYPWICCFRGVYGDGDFFTVVKSSSKDGTWTNATDFPHELGGAVYCWEGCLLPLSDGKMYVTATHSSPATITLKWVFPAETREAIMREVWATFGLISLFPLILGATFITTILSKRNQEWSLTDLLGVVALVATLIIMIYLAVLLTNIFSGVV